MYTTRVQPESRRSQLPGRAQSRDIRSWHLLLISLIVQTALLLYADHVDSHPERYGGLQYTDVDWRVVSDGAKLIFQGGGSNGAQGWLMRWIHLPIGDPYKRSTFRYTPLLPLLLSPTALHSLAGKLVLVVISLLIPPILLWRPRSSRDRPADFWPVHLLWTLNPFVLNITTRGSPEAIAVLLVVALLACMRGVQAVNVTNPARDDRAIWERRAAITLAIAISYKIYPIIYVPAIWTVLAARHGWLGWGIWRFGFTTAGTLLAVNGVLWSIWGQPFLEHTFLYHLHRQDHRHNFSPYFYPIYLSFFPSNQSPALDAPSPGMVASVAHTLARLQRALRNPLVSFIPQNTLMLLAGFLLPQAGRTRRRAGIDSGVDNALEITMLLQTAMFVVFNKVCTSQYFTWFLPLLAPLIPSLSRLVTPRRTFLLVGVWIAAQALWLGMAYRLEFRGESVHLEVWGAGLILFGVSVWVLGQVMDGCGTSDGLSQGNAVENKSQGWSRRAV